MKLCYVHESITQIRIEFGGRRGKQVDVYSRLHHDKPKRSLWIAWLIEYSQGRLVELRLDCRERRCAIVILPPPIDLRIVVDDWETASRVEAHRLLDGEQSEECILAKASHERVAEKKAKAEREWQENRAQRLARIQAMGADESRLNGVEAEVSA